MLRSVTSLIACLALATCVASSAAPSREPIAADALEAAQAVQDLLERHEAAWGTKDADHIMSFWGDDIHFTDLGAGRRDEPRTTVEQMVRSTLLMWPDLGDGPKSYFVDTTGGVVSLDFWGIGGITEADPIHEVDAYGTDGGLLVSLHTSFDLRTLGRIGGFGDADTFAAMEDLIEGYADAWSSGAMASVADLYAESAVRTNKLWAEAEEGRDAISDAATRYFSLNPGAVWELELVFGDGDLGVMRGGVFTIHLAAPDSCDLGAAVVVEVSEAQRITSERLYWDIDSLLGCGLD